MPPSHAPQDEASRMIFLEYQSRAEMGDALAQFNLGSCYYHGRFADRDVAEAVKWFRKAAQQNLAEAELHMGSCFFYGTGVERDYAEAYAWFCLAASNPQGTDDDRRMAKEKRDFSETRIPVRKP